MIFNEGVFFIVFMGNCFIISFLSWICVQFLKIVDINKRNVKFFLGEFLKFEFNYLLQLI